MTVPKVELCVPPLPASDIVQKSVDLTDFYLTQKGWSSHQSVFKAVAEVYNIAYPPQVLRLLSGFTAGVGFTGGICGALSGGIAILGFIYGTEGPMPEDVYRPFIDTILDANMLPQNKAERLVASLFADSFLYNKLVEDFKSAFGYSNCAELISPYKDDPISRRRFGNCRRIVRGAAGLTARLVLDLESGSISPSIGDNIYSHLLRKQAEK